MSALGGCATNQSSTPVQRNDSRPGSSYSSSSDSARANHEPARLDLAILERDLQLRPIGQDPETGGFFFQAPQGNTVVLIPGLSSALIDGAPVRLGGMIRTGYKGEITLPFSARQSLASALSTMRQRLASTPAASTPPLPPTPSHAPAPRPAPAPAVPLPAAWNVRTSRKWKSIVLHHSATQRGSAASFDKAHRKRGWRRGLGYHFVIGNGSGSGDGKIEVGPRWKHQQSGAHAGAGAHFYNNYGIGICLVGNFEQTNPTPRQMRALKALVQALSGRFHIAAAKIFTHRQIRPKPTRCPGDRFPLKELIRSLKGPSS